MSHRKIIDSVGVGESKVKGSTKATACDMEEKEKINSFGDYMNGYVKKQGKRSERKKE